MSKASLHVVTHDDTWAIKREGEPVPLSLYPTQEDAIRAAEDLGRKEDAAVMVHRRDGTFRTVRTFEVASEGAPIGDEVDGRPALRASLVAGALLAASVVALLVVRRRIF